MGAAPRRTDANNRENAQTSRPGGGRDLSATKAAIVAVLDALGFGGKRASKLDVDDYLNLLARFNAAGVHFHA